jgi:hypothetical protein
MNRIRQIGSAVAIAGATVFLCVLFISAYWESDIRWLHFLQSWMYLAAIALMLKESKWGCFIGFGAAIFWDYVNLFITTFLRAGLAQTQAFIHTGHIARPDLLLSVPGWFGNLAVIVGCILAYSATPKRQVQDLFGLAIATTGTTAYFALSMFLCQPRYLALFPALLHPHLHF